MISIHKSLLFLALVTLSLSLLHHEAADPDVQYYGALLEKQSELRSSLTVIGQEIESLNRTLAKLEGFPSLQMVAVSDTIADQNNILQEIALNHTLPSRLKSVNCTNVSQQDLDNLTASIQQVEQDLEEVGQRISDLESTHSNLTESLTLQYEWAQIYLRQLQNASQALNKCPQQANRTQGTVGVGNVSNYTNGSNLTVPNWVYGNTTVTDFNIKLFQFLTANNVTSCPKETPFVLANTTNCSACVNPTPIFDANVRKCISGCPNGTSFNQTSHLCQQNTPNLTCGNGQIKVKNSQGVESCECPQSSPYYNGVSCVSCYLPNHWNTTNLACQTCPNGTIYSIETDRCTICPNSAPLQKGGRCYTCPSGSYYYNVTNECVSCPNGTVYNQSTHSCERPVCSASQVWNSTLSKCQQCPFGQVAYQGQCYYCPEGTHYDADKHTCLKCQDGSTFDNATQTCVIKCSGGSVYNTTAGQCNCPADRPFSDGVNCVSCNRPSYWSNSAKACLQCPANQVYNSNSLRCESCPLGFVYNPVTYSCQSVVCPSGTYLVNGQCYTCPNNTHYNTTTHQCVSCPAGTTFNSATYQCVGSSTGNGTNGSISCPSNTFWDGQTCVTCYLPQYWNLDTRKCENCQSGKHYDVTLKACVVCPDNSVFDLNKYQCISSSSSSSSSNSSSSSSSGSSSSGSSSSGSSSSSCPSSTPFWNGTNCVSCFLPKHWNHDRNQCESCPSGENYDVSVKKCRVCESGSNFNFSTYTCQ